MFGSIPSPRRPGRCLQVVIAVSGLLLSAAPANPTPQKVTLKNEMGVVVDSPLMLTIMCAGSSVGIVKVMANELGGSSKPGAISATFTRTGTFAEGKSEGFLAEAAAKCDEHHFNWYQKVTADSTPPPSKLDPLKPLKPPPPYLDPPLGGYAGQWADMFDWYYNETTIPSSNPADLVFTPPNYNNFTEMTRPKENDVLVPACTKALRDAGTFCYDHEFNLFDNVVDSNGNNTLDYLRYSDFPCSTHNLSFITSLASVNEDGSLHTLRGTFQWEWSPDTDHNDPCFGRQAPEPASIVLVVVGLTAFGLLRRGRSERDNGEI